MHQISVSTRAPRKKKWAHAAGYFARGVLRLTENQSPVMQERIMSGALHAARKLIINNKLDKHSQPARRICRNSDRAGDIAFHQQSSEPLNAVTGVRGNKRVHDAADARVPINGVRPTNGVRNDLDRRSMPRGVEKSTIY